MPAFQITAPDGKKYRVSGEGTAEQALAHFQAQWKPEQAETALDRMKRSDPGEYDTESPEYKAKYGNTGSTLRIPFTQIDTGIPVPAGKGGGPNMWERFGHGANQTVAGVRQLWNKVTGDQAEGEQITANTNDAERLYQAGRREGAGGGKPGIDWMSGLGAAAQSAPLAILPGGGAGVLGRSAAGALAGAAGGAVQFDPENTWGNRAENAGTGALVGAVAAPVVGAVADRVPAAVSAITGRLKGVLQKFRGNATPQAILQQVPELAQAAQANPQAFNDLIAEAQAMLTRTGTLDEAQLARKANLLANNVTPTKSMVTRDPADWSRERNLQKLAQSPDEQLSSTGQQLTEVYQGNDRALTERLGAIRGNLPAGSAEQHGMTVMKSLDDMATASQKDVSALYEQVRQARGADLASDARNLVAKLDDLQDSTYSEKLVTSVRNKLKRFGMLDAEGNLTPKSLTVEQAEELRKFVNTLPNDYGRKDIIRAIDADVMHGLGDDAFGGARKAAQERFQALDNPATQRALNTLGELQQGKTAQNFVQSQIIDAADQDVQSLIATLGALDPAKKQAALDAMKAGVMQHLSEASMKGATGSQQFSGAGLDKALREIGDKKLEMVLGADQLAQIKSLSRAAVDATYQPPFAAVNHSNTAPMLLSLTQRARMVPGVPLIVSEELQKGAARSGYAGQLSEALAAKAGSGVRRITPEQKRLATALGTAAGVGGAAAVQERRKSTNQRNH